MGMRVVELMPHEEEERSEAAMQEGDVREGREDEESNSKVVPASTTSISTRRRPRVMCKIGKSSKRL